MIEFNNLMKAPKISFSNPAARDYKFLAHYQIFCRVFSFTLYDFVSNIASLPNICVISLRTNAVFSACSDQDVKYRIDTSLDPLGDLNQNPNTQTRNPTS